MVKVKNFEVKKPIQGLLSVIVPAYNCKTIDRDLQGINNYLKAINIPAEIVCVVDGLKSSKDKTADLARSVRGDNIRVFPYKVNRGKGYAVRYGMARAKGSLIAFIDAGNDLSASGLPLAIEHLRWYNADIIIGSKRHKASKVNYPFQRKILSFFVQKATLFFFGLNVSDTQTGLKVFKREVLEKVLPRLLVKRWAFDLEILAVAHRLGFTRIFESPIELQYNFASNITYRAVLNFAIDYLAIFYRIHILHYYDDKHVDLWADDPELTLRYRS